MARFQLIVCVICIYSIPHIAFSQVDDIYFEELSRKTTQYYSNVYYTLKDINSLNPNDLVPLINLSHEILKCDIVTGFLKGAYGTYIKLTPPEEISECNARSVLNNIFAIRISIFEAKTQLETIVKQTSKWMSTIEKISIVMICSDYIKDLNNLISKLDNWDSKIRGTYNIK